MPSHCNNMSNGSSSEERLTGQRCIWKQYAELRERPDGHYRDAELMTELDIVQTISKDSCDSHRRTDAECNIEADRIVANFNTIHLVHTIAGTKRPGQATTAEDYHAPFDSVTETFAFMRLKGGSSVLAHDANSSLTLPTLPVPKNEVPRGYDKSPILINDDYFNLSYESDTSEEGIEAFADLIENQDSMVKAIKKNDDEIADSKPRTYVPDIYEGDIYYNVEQRANDWPSMTTTRKTQKAAMNKNHKKLNKQSNKKPSQKGTILFSNSVLNTTYVKSKPVSKSCLSPSSPSSSSSTSTLSSSSSPMPSSSSSFYISNTPPSSHTSDCYAATPIATSFTGGSIGVTPKELYYLKKSNTKK